MRRIPIFSLAPLGECQAGRRKLVFQSTEGKKEGGKGIKEKEKKKNTREKGRLEYLILCGILKLVLTRAEKATYGTDFST